MVEGGPPGSIEIDGVEIGDRLIAVHRFVAGGLPSDLTGEFSISAADTIENDGGTDSTGSVLVVYFGDSAG